MTSAQKVFCTCCHQAYLPMMFLSFAIGRCWICLTDKHLESCNPTGEKIKPRCDDCGGTIYSLRTVNSFQSGFETEPVINEPIISVLYVTNAIIRLGGK